jgi:hypothetical protein
VKECIVRMTHHVHFQQTIPLLCSTQVYFEDYESKYSPGSWESSDQFDTLKECCVAKVSEV